MTRPTMGFWVIGILLLLWNLMGDAAYLSQVTTDLDALARTDPATARAFAEMPKWVWGVYAVAVWSGTAAAIALLLRRKVAIWLFVLSLAAIVVQFGRSFLMTDLIAEQGWSTIIFPVVIFVLGLFPFWWSRLSASQGWLR